MQQNPGTYNSTSMLQEADYLEIDRYLDGVMTDDELVVAKVFAC